MVAAIWAAATGAAEFHGKPYEGGDLYADTWVATDGAGRVMPGFKECGPVKPDKWVGIFYWTWHTPNRGGPNDNTKIIAAAKGGPVTWLANGAPYHWGEPELGYYLMTDPFVIRKHASLLVEAGIDVILFDTTNPPFTWKEQYESLCREYAAMRRQGARTPGIGFIAPFGDPRPVTDQLWRDLYQPGLWKELWFMWEGKPLLLADKQFIKDPKMLSFFTFRRPMPDYWAGPSGPDQWGWLEVYPQHVFKNSRGAPEQMSVGVAQNALPNTPGPAPMSHKAGAMGRSWRQGKADPTAGAVDLGRNFEEQWRRASEVDPRFIFFAQTLERIIPRTGRNWMLLFLDADQDATTGWLGYDFLINLEARSDTETTVKAWRNGKWETIGKASYRVNGNGMEIGVARGLIGQTGRTPAFDFHWADNIQRLNEVSDFGLNGDSAPDRRWNYRFGSRESSTPQGAKP